MEKIVLKGKVYFDKGIPMISLSDDQGNSFIGHLTYLSVEELGRQYQKDNEYGSKTKNKYSYFVQYENSDIEIQLFQKVIPQGYGEEPIIIDETNKYEFNITYTR